MANLYSDVSFMIKLNVVNWMNLKTCSYARDVNETKIWQEREWEQLNEDKNENETKNKFWEHERDQQPWEREREQWKNKI